MNRLLRRFVLGIGAALLVGGWGATHYADEQQQIPSSPTAKYRMWMLDDERGMWSRPASRRLYGGGVISMGLGAFLIGVSILPLSTNRAEPH